MDSSIHGVTKTSKTKIKTETRKNGEKYYTLTILITETNYKDEEMEYSLTLFSKDKDALKLLRTK